MAPGTLAADLLAPDLDRGDAHAWCSVAQEFADDVIGPVGRVLDRMDASEVTAPGSPLYDLLAQAHREGFTRLGVPRHAGGPGLTRAEEGLVVEILAAADAGLTALLLTAPAPFLWAFSAGRPGLRERLAEPYARGRRPDWIGCRALDGPAGPLRATRVPAGWRLTGLTAPVLGGAVATHALVACVRDGPGAPAAALAVVALDRRGVWRRRAGDGSGLWGLCRASLVLDRLELRPDEVVALHEGAGRGWGDGGRADAASALVALGIGRAAYEGALRWARESLWSGGAPAAGTHARPQLSRMFVLLEATQALVRSAYQAVEPAPGDPADRDHDARATRAFAAEAAFEVASEAMRLCGGLPRGRRGVRFLDGSAFHPEKLLRDARTTHPTKEEGGHGPREDP